jgi:ABC-type amino acid transport substrate-binding protein
MKQNRLTVIDYLLDQKHLLLTKEEVENKGLFNSPPYSMSAKVYIGLFKGNIDNVHVPHSDVYYVRTAVEKHTGYYFPLDAVEEAMKTNGWRDRRNSWRYNNVN